MSLPTMCAASAARRMLLQLVCWVRRSARTIRTEGLPGDRSGAGGDRSSGHRSPRAGDGAEFRPRTGKAGSASSGAATDHVRKRQRLPASLCPGCEVAMDVAMNVVLLVAAMVAAAAGIGAVLALKMTQRNRAIRSRAPVSRARSSRLDARDTRSGHGSSARSGRHGSSNPEGFEVKARIKALRASLHRDHEKPASKEPPPPVFADTEVFEDGDEMPTIVMHAQPAQAATPTLSAAPKTPSFELLKLDFGNQPAPKVAAEDSARRGLAR